MARMPRGAACQCEATGRASLRGPLGAGFYFVDPAAVLLVRGREGSRGCSFGGGGRSPCRLV